MCMSACGGLLLELANHYTMRKRISEWRKHPVNLSALEKITVTHELFQQLHFEDDGKEVEYRNRMYDIIWIDTSGEQTVIYCLDDKKETALKQSTGRHNSQKDDRYKLLVSKNLAGPVRLLNDFYQRMTSTIFRRHLTPFLPRVPRDILKPPPDLAVS